MFATLTGTNNLSNCSPLTGPPGQARWCRCTADSRTLRRRQETGDDAKRQRIQLLPAKYLIEKSLLRRTRTRKRCAMSGRYRLPNGREVCLGRFEVEATYSGLIEGSLEQGSRLILRSLAETAAKSLGSDNPLVVVNPGVIPPRYHLGARLFSPTPPSSMPFIPPGPTPSSPTAPFACSRRPSTSLSWPP
jgi:hypothetical protein